MNIVSLINTLQGYRGRNVFNPYIDRCTLCDLTDAPSIRSENLRLTLSSFLESGVDSIWIGRDLGYRGGRRTGLAFTDEVHLQHAAQAWNVQLKKATKGAVSREKTATCIWSKLNQIDEHIFTWNVFPYHPYEKGKQLSNRCHTFEERKFGVNVMHSIVSMLEPKRMVAIGNDAYNCLIKIFPNRDIVKVRHPSYGGESVFAEQIRKLYDL